MFSNSWEGCRVLYPGVKTHASETLDEVAFALLDATAEQCNRVLACIDNPNQNATLLGMKAELREATEESIAFAIEHSLAMRRFPEARSMATIAGNRHRELVELADKVESISVLGCSSTKSPILQGAVQRALEELRFHLLARQEIEDSLSVRD
jgi:hypothetical protein